MLLKVKCLFFKYFESVFHLAKHLILVLLLFIYLLHVVISKHQNSLCLSRLFNTFLALHLWHIHIQGGLHKLLNLCFYLVWVKSIGLENNVDLVLKFVGLVN